MEAMATLLWDGSGSAGSAAERAWAGACPRVQGHPELSSMEAMLELSWNDSGRRRECCRASAGAGGSLSLRSGASSAVFHGGYGGALVERQQAEPGVLQSGRGRPQEPVPAFKGHAQWPPPRGYGGALAGRLWAGGSAAAASGGSLLDVVCPVKHGEAVERWIFWLDGQDGLDQTLWVF
jgi:hypothetical protein